jgi:hypothetical protein
MSPAGSRRVSRSTDFGPTIGAVTPGWSFVHSAAAARVHSRARFARSAKNACAAGGDEGSDDGVERVVAGVSAASTQSQLNMAILRIR